MKYFDTRDKFSLVFLFENNQYNILKINTIENILEM